MNNTVIKQISDITVFQRTMVRPHNVWRESRILQIYSNLHSQMLI